MTTTTDPNATVPVRIASRSTGLPAPALAGDVVGGSHLRILAADQTRSAALPRLSTDQLIDLLRQAGLQGRGGAGFPAWRKLATVAATRRRPVLVANAAEGEPASAKDRVLLRQRPDLVLDGLSLLSGALQAREVYLYVGDADLLPGLQAELDARRAVRRDPVPVRLEVAPQLFLAGEESAAANWLSGGPVAPRTKPPLVLTSGVRGRPTLIHNVETLAHIALLARHGAGWFRQAGTRDEPGTMLMTVSGAVRRPAVLEVPVGTSIPEVIDLAGGATRRLSALLLGGYGGGWISAAAAATATTSRASLTPLGSSLGAGVVVAFPDDRCGLAETARLVAYLARESAGQCGPCLNGLPHLARLMQMLASGSATPAVLGELERVSGLVTGRGACRHPDGTARLIRSALLTFGDEAQLHLAGRCSARTTTPLLPVDQEHASCL
ncbi:MAG TPA: NADH-ubiquinone oxidoreductase-F iron-sulfur binding region domain-containing protein [Frankiaceae bacterium]|nr:NADH-ubiquinone oxidoreductase-F iron-sulfur binding region domain-containing protein [Frankiaceae bacterium]